MIKQQTVIKYSILATDKQAPQSPMGRCPKLTRYKIASGLIIFAFSVLLMVTTFSRMDGLRFRDTSRAYTFYSIAVYHSSGKGSDGVNDAEDGVDSVPQGRSCSGTGNVNKECGNHQRARRQLKKRFPSAIVIGARKAGTRALLRFINLHPDVATSRQETHFFDRHYDKGLDWYKYQMPYSFDGQLIVEKTPNYFVDWDVPERVYNFNSSIKLILIVRNPIDRAVSDYVQLKEKFHKSGQEQYFGSFEELVFDKYTGEINKSYAPIKRSLYCRHLEKWLNFFQMPQLFVVDGENIKIRPWEEMYKLEEFLGLPHKITKDRFVYNQTKGFYCIKLDRRSKVVQTGENVPDFLILSDQCLAESKGRNHPVLAHEVRHELLKFFQPFNNRFFAAIGKTFDWT